MRRYARHNDLSLAAAMTVFSAAILCRSVRLIAQVGPGNK